MICRKKISMIVGLNPECQLTEHNRIGSIAAAITQQRRFRHQETAFWCRGGVFILGVWTSCLALPEETAHFLWDFHIVILAQEW